MLVRRGFGDPAAARRFLQPSLDDLLDPLAMRDMSAAIERLRRAISNGEKILIYGDYDVDGTTSVVLLTKAIELAEGMAADGVKLIVSVDTGIRAAQVVRRAAELGIDVVVTDHHLPESELPPALAVLNPNRPDCGYPDKNLCGAGVAFKLVQGLLATMGWPEAKVRRICESFLKIAAIATVADVVPLTGGNRVIVKHGLGGLNDVRNLGLRALLEVAGFSNGSVPSARQVAFQIAPRINAAGRMDTANAVIELYLTSDPARAHELAKLLHDQNIERQQVELEIRQACEQIPLADGAAALVYYNESWHRGVLGIVAARLVERFYRPVFVLGRNEEDGTVQGSGRSIPAFHLLNALEAMPDLFRKFGGHAHAAGVTLDAANVEEFRRRFNAYAVARLSPEDLMRQVEVDALVDLRELTDEAVTDVFSLAPFGNGNPPPLFAATDVEVARPPAVMKERHLRITVRQNGRIHTLKAWNYAERIDEFPTGARLDIAFQLEEDAHSAARGYAPWCAVLKDFRPTGLRR